MDCSKYQFISAQNLLASVRQLRKISPSSMTTRSSALEWPTQSPDWNPVKNQWSDFMRAVCRRYSCNLIALKTGRLKENLSALLQALYYKSIFLNKTFLFCFSLEFCWLPCHIKTTIKYTSYLGFMFFVFNPENLPFYSVFYKRPALLMHYNSLKLIIHATFIHYTCFLLAPCLRYMIFCITVIQMTCRFTWQCLSSKQPF